MRGAAINQKTIGVRYYAKWLKRIFTYVIKYREKCGPAKKRMFDFFFLLLSFFSTSSVKLISFVSSVIVGLSTDWKKGIIYEFFTMKPARLFNYSKRGPL